MELRIKCRAESLDRLKAVLPECLLELADAELQSLDPCLVDALRLVVECFVQVVECREEPGDQVSRRVLDRLVLGLARPLLEVVEVGGRAQVTVLGPAVADSSSAILASIKAADRDSAEAPCACSAIGSTVSFGSCGCLRVAISF